MARGDRVRSRLSPPLSRSRGAGDGDALASSHSLQGERAGLTPYLAARPRRGGVALRVLQHEILCSRVATLQGPVYICAEIHVIRRTAPSAGKPVEGVEGRGGRAEGSIARRASTSTSTSTAFW
eukprot:2604411-Prymnesium_polylepis.1